MTTDELIRKSSPAIAVAILASAKNAKKEAEVRISFEREIAQLAKQAGISLEGRHEFTVASGFVDSVYDKVIIEYKNPSSPSDRIGKDLQSAGSLKLVSQIKSRFYDLRTQEGRTLNSLLGVGIDGNRFIFARFREDQWDIQEPVEVNATSVRRFLTALFNLGTRGKALSPAALAQDFGGESQVATDGIKKFYDALIKSRDPKTNTLLGQWKMLFSEVSGYDEGSGKNKLADLATLYGIKPRVMKGPELLFALQTYYALLMKLLAAEVISYYQGLTSPIQKIVKSSDSRALRIAISDIENGGIFKHLNITNFLEGDLFSWYAWEWPAGVDEVVRTVAERLDNYNPGTLSEDPAGTKDLLKKLYHKLFPKSVRHALGEYYTPDWLAAHVAEDAGYAGNPDHRVLDPSCGSGTFLVEAINRVKAYFDEHMESLPYDERGLADRILLNIVGFDLNPIAVLAARTNFLIAIRELVPRLDKVEIPVYLCDSVLTPSEYGDLFTGTDPVARVPCVAIKPPYLMVPKEIASSQSTVNAYTDALMHCVNMKFSVDEFMHHCAEERLNLSETESHRNLYTQLELLKHQNRDGIWARIIRNAFAPLFAGTFDFVLGNPPWINWESLPDGYRRLTAATWEHYRLQGGSASGTRQSSSRNKTDMSILLTYVAADKYLRRGGKLSFVITRSIFHSELGGKRFRQLRLPDGRFLDVHAVNDLDPISPFRGQAANVTCTFSLSVGKKTTFPVPWNVWKQRGKATISEDDDLKVVIKKTEILHWAAEPIDDHSLDSSWLFADPLAFKVLRRLIGPSAYAEFAREGVNTRGANGVFFVDAWTLGRQTFVRNRPTDGKNAEIDTYEGAIETDYLYPLLRGRDVSRWSATPSHFIVLPHSPDRPTYPPRLIDLPKKTREFLSHFAEALASRSSFRNFNPSGAEQYGLYSVLNATFAPYKVVWREMATGTIAAICTISALPNGTEKTVIPDHKLFIIPCTSLEEATFVCGVFNSAIASYIIRSYALATGISTHVLNRLGIPLYSSKNPKHKAVVMAASRCISNRTSNMANSAFAASLDEAVGELYGLSSAELETITNANGKLSGIPIDVTEV